jgi:hypothetical protein
MKKLLIVFAAAFCIGGYCCWQEWALSPLAIIAFLFAGFFLLGARYMEEEHK